MVTVSMIKENPMAAIIDLNRTILECDDMISKMSNHIDELEKAKADAEMLKAQIMFLETIGAL